MPTNSAMNRVLRLSPTQQRTIPALVFFRNGPEISTNASPYQATVLSVANSGLSFGRIQNDAGQNIRSVSTAYNTVRNIVALYERQPELLAAAGITQQQFATLRSSVLTIAGQPRSYTFFEAGGLRPPTARFFTDVAAGTTGASLGFASKGEYETFVTRLFSTRQARYIIDVADHTRAQYDLINVDRALTPLLNRSAFVTVGNQAGGIIRPDPAGILNQTGYEGNLAYFTLVKIFNVNEGSGRAASRELSNLDHPVNLADIRAVAAKYGVNFANIESGVSALQGQTFDWVYTVNGYSRIVRLTETNYRNLAHRISFNPSGIGADSGIISNERFADGSYHYIENGLDRGFLPDSIVFDAILADPATTYQLINGVSAAVAQNGITFYLPQTITGATVLTQNAPPGGVVGDLANIGSAFGSIIGRSLGGSSLVVATAAGSIVTALAFNLGQVIQASISGGYYSSVKGETVILAAGKAPGSVFDDFGSELGQIGKNAAIGAASSYLALELGQALGLGGFGSGLFSAGVGGVLSHVAANVTNGAKLFSGLSAVKGLNANGQLVKAGFSASQLGTLLESSFAGFFGQKLAELVITPKTPVQALFASAGAAALSIFADVAIGKALGFAGAAAGPVGVLVGTFVGFIVGALIGKLFGKPKPRIPTASAETVLQIPNARYAVGLEVSANGGNLAFVDSIAITARDTLNGLIDVITRGQRGSFVANVSSPTQTYGVTGSQIYVRLGIGAAAINVSSADEAVDRGVRFALPLTQIIGGDIILKRAVAASDATTVSILAGDLQIAADYEQYLTAAPFIDALISQSYASLSEQDKLFFNANKSIFTRILSRSEIALSPSDQLFFNANLTQVNRIVNSANISPEAAGWILTLARAGELSLNQFGRSDFYGGAQGFLQSFNFAAVGTGVHYEDTAFSLSGGNLTITASGLASADVFSLLPQASADGRSVTITGFGANVGYTVQSIGVRSSGNDFEIAPANGAAVTVSAGTPGFNLGYYGGYYPGTDGGDDIIIGGSGNDNLSSGAGDVWIDGAAGHDIIYGGAGRNVLIGGDGVDQIFGGAGDDYIAGGAGNDYIQPWIGGPAPGGLFGGDGNDIIVGGGGLDGVFGENGDDVLIVDEDGGATFDYYDGGVGSDTASFERFTSAVNFNLTTGRGSGYTAVTYGDGFVAIENVTGSNSNDIIYGDEVANTLKGLGGNDQLYGGEGNDIIEGGEGVDIISGGGGTNTASFLGSSAGVYVNLATGTTIGGDATGDVLTAIQNLTGSNYGDELAGDAGINIISTGVGDDYIDATTGADTYNGGDGFDTLDYSLGTFSSLYVTLNAATGYSYHYNSAGTFVYQSLSSIEQVIGTAANDSFSSSGTNLNVTWDGNGGSDYISGGTGSDTYVYGQGYGVVSISDSKSASNTIRFKAGTTFDQLWAANSGGTLQLGIRGAAGYIQAYSNAATVGNNVIKFLDLGGIAQVDVTQVNAVYAGSDGADTIYGAATTSNLIFANNGNDTIYGAGGALSQKGSIIAGGLGNDYIVTSSGDDQFLFERGNGRDTIVDGGGQNSIIFGSTVSANDVIYQVVGNDLYVGIKDLANEALTASQVADYVVVANGGVIRINQNTGAQTRYTTITVQAGGNTIDTTKADIDFTLQYYTPPGGGGGGGGGGGCANCQIPPIILDLTGDGLQITPVGQSDIVTRDANGNILRTSWVGPTNGILAFDRNGDGKINNTADISFVQDKHGATTDLEGLAGRDSNADGVLDASDEFFSKLVVWVDANQDGRAKKSEVKTLAELGIVSISLKPLATGFDDSDTLDTVIRNTTTFTRVDGSIGTGYDVALARQLLNGDPASAVGADVDLSAVAEFGKLKNHLAPLPGRTIGLNTIGASGAPVDADFSEAGGSLSAAAAARFATILDPVKNKAFKDLIANGTVGEEFLDQIRSTKARSDDGGVLVGRASRDPKSRLQAIVVDFNRNGADLVDPTKSRAFVDAARDGTVSQIGWVRPSDGVLAFDRNDDGAVDARSEISFLGDAPNARTSLQGLRSFDSNGDGVLSSADGSFAKFLIWRDVNGNGFSEAGETQSLAQAAVKSITLDTSNLRPDRGVGSSNDVLGVSKITFTDDSERAIYDVALGFADSKEADAKAPSQSAQSARPNSGPVPAAAVSNDSVGLATNAAPKLLASANVIGRSRGSLDGPAGAIVEATSTSVDDSQWWRDASIVGQSYANLANAIAGQNSALGANQSSFAGAGATDAATLQRLLLLRQNIASLQPSTGGSAAIFNRGAANDLSPLAATALRPVTQATQQAGVGG